MMENLGFFKPAIGLMREPFSAQGKGVGETVSRKF
jgi:hypothetical protein